MSTGFQLRQDNVQDDINKLKKPEGTKFTQIKSRGQNDVPSSLDPPKWAREGATKFTKWLSETSLAGDKMEIALAKMMIPAVKDPNVKLKECADLDANLNREVKVVKSVREKIKYNSEKTKLGWNDKEVTIWLLLGFDDGKGTYLLRFVGSVHVDGRSQKGVRLVEKEVSIWANAYLKIDVAAWNTSREIRFSEVKIILEELSFAEQTGKWVSSSMPATSKGLDRK